MQHLALFGFVLGEDEALDQRQPVTEEHVLRAAQPDPLGAEPPRDLRVVRKVGVGAHAQATELVGPREDRLERPGRLRRDDGDRADDDLAGRAVDRDDIAFTDDGVAHLELLAVDIDVERARAADRRLAHATRDDRRVADQTAPRREDALGRDHAVQVVGRRLRAHEDHVLAVGVARFGFVSSEVHLADGRAR